MTKTEAIVGLIDLVIDAVPFGSTLPVSQVYSAWTAFQTPQFAKQKDKLLKNQKNSLRILPYPKGK